MSNVKVWGCRGSLIGDCVAALPVYAHVRKQYPDAVTWWQVARKCAQAAPLFYNNPLITTLCISDCNEGMGPRDRAIAATCNLVFDVTPPGHPDGDVWPNLGRSVYHEVARMAGVSDEQYATLTEEEKWPHLAQWFTTERRQKAIAIWPGSRQGEKQLRNPDHGWWNHLCLRLAGEGYTVYQCGHPNDLKDYPPLGRDVRELSLLELIRLSLGCDLVIGTDSGSMIALAAYHSTPTISLLCPHWPGHRPHLNPMCFGPLGARHVNLWAPTNNGHDIDKVLDTIRQLT